MPQIVLHSASMEDNPSTSLPVAVKAEQVEQVPADKLTRLKVRWTGVP